jgi:hypothetical protein
VGLLRDQIAEPMVEIHDGPHPHDDTTEIITGDERQDKTDRVKTRCQLLEAVASSKPVVAQKSSTDNSGAGDRATQRPPLHQ